MAGRVDLKKRIQEMMKLISPESPHPEKHFKEANKLVIDMAEANIPTEELTERLYFLTEGFQEKDTRPAGERLRKILKENQLP